MTVERPASLRRRLAEMCASLAAHYQAKCSVVSQFENRCPGSPSAARSDCIEHVWQIPLNPPFSKGEARQRRGISGQNDSLPEKKCKLGHSRVGGLLDEPAADMIDLWAHLREDGGCNGRTCSD